VAQSASPACIVGRGEMNTGIRKPPDSPNGNPERWQQEWKAYIEGSWEDVGQETRKAFEESDPKDTDVPPREKPAGHGEEKCDEADLKAHRNEELYEVEGELPPLVQEGSRIMVCVRYEYRKTRYEAKDYLYWIDEETGQPFTQYVNHPDKYKMGGRAVRNYIVAMGERPKRLDRISLRNLIGLRAEVYVETVKPEYSVGRLKGRPMPESMHYSKVSEILRPLGRVDSETLKQLRNKC